MAVPFFTTLYTKNHLKTLDFVKLFVVFIALLLTARIGLYLALFFLIPWGVSAVSKFIFHPTMKKVVEILGFISLCLLVFTVIINSSSLMVGIFLDEGIWHSFEIFTNILAGNGAQVDSFKTISQFTVHNESLLDHIFGTGLYGRGEASTYLNTDISYAHFYSMVGIVGVLLIVNVYVGPLFQYRRLFMTKEYALLAFTSLIVLIGNIKEATFFTRTITSVWLLFLFSVVEVSRKKD
jgi:hypothetical protein